MTPRTPKRRLLAGLAAGTLVLAACGSDESDSEVDDSVEVTTAPDAEAEDEASADDEDAMEDGEDAMEDGEDAMEDGEDAMEDGEDAMEDGEDAMEDGEDAMEDGESAGTIVDVAASTEGFSTLVAAVEAAGLAETLSSDGPFTVFAPTDEAFAALPAGLLDALLLPENVGALEQILLYHVVGAEVPSSDVAAGPVTTAQGEDAEIVIDGDTITIAGATIVQTDIDASNGVIHVIDQVIVPPSIDPSTLLEGDGADDGAGDADEGDGEED